MRYRKRCVIKKARTVRDDKLPSQYPQKLIKIVSGDEIYLVSSIPIRTINFSNYFTIHQDIVIPYIKKYKNSPKEFCENISELPNPITTSGVGICTKTYVYFIIDPENKKRRTLSTFGKMTKRFDISPGGWRKFDPKATQEDFYDPEFSPQLFSSYAPNFTELLLETVKITLEKWTKDGSKFMYSYFPMVNLLLTNYYYSFFPEGWSEENK